MEYRGYKVEGEREFLLDDKTTQMIIEINDANYSDQCHVNREKLVGIINIALITGLTQLAHGIVLGRTTIIGVPQAARQGLAVLMAMVPLVLKW